MKRFNLTCDYINLFPKIIFKFELSIPHLSSLKDNRLSEEVLMFDSFLTLMHEKIDFIYCVEFKKLKPEFAYETWRDLAQKFGFEAPKNPEIFKNRINRNRGDLVHLPVELYIHPADLKHRFIQGRDSQRQNTLSLSMQGGFSLIITLPHYLNEEQKTFKELSEEFFNEKLIISDTQILLIIKQQDYENLKKIKALYEATKEYIKGYIEALKAEVKRNKANLYSEEELLEYLKIDSKLRKEIKELCCDSELAYIKENYPDFIASWKYYNEFEKICKELDEIK